jgi:hypothetical protein
MKHIFIIKKEGVLTTYNKYEDIPESFDHVIKFVPDIPPGPHNQQQHNEIEDWNNKLEELMRRENASSN